MNTLITELRRRNIFRVAGVYAVVGWLLAQAAGVLETSMNMPAWFDTMVVSLLLIGFPIAMLLAWAFEMTPEGVKRTENVAEGDSATAKTGRKLDYVIVIGLVLVAALVVWQGMRDPSGPFEAAKSAAPQGEVGKVADNAAPQSLPRTGSGGEVGGVTNINPHPEVLGDSQASKDADAQTTQAPSIAVLPFEDFSQDKDQEYFANGISEELLNVLARIKGLRVASRTSAFSFQGGDAKTGEIAEALNVGHILEGSIRKSGTTLRITAQLIDASTDQHMWSETYDRPLTAENLFQIQDEIAAAIVGELKGRLSIRTTEAPARTQSLEAYELYLRARVNMNKRLPATLTAAVAGFKQVIALDPDFAPAYAGLADSYLLMLKYTDISFDESQRLAKPNVERALQLAPNAAESLTSAAFLALTKNEFEKAVALADRAIAVTPNYSDAYLRKFNASNGTKERLASIEKARALDPLSAVILSNLGAAQVRAGDREAARKTMRDNVSWNPDSIFGYIGLGALLYQEGELAAAHSHYKDAQALNSEASIIQTPLSNLYFDVGLYGEVSAVSPQVSDRALALLLGGQKQQGMKLVQDNPDDPSMGYVLYVAGDVKNTYAIMRKFVKRYNVLEQTVNADTAEWLATIAFIFQENGDPDANILIGNLETYLGKDASAADKVFNSDLRAGIILQLLKGDKSAAYAWLDRYLDLGFADTVLLTTPPFESLRRTPKFAKRETRMAQNAARHRAKIEAQLANPKPNWVKETP